MKVVKCFASLILSFKSISLFAILFASCLLSFSFLPSKEDFPDIYYHKVVTATTSSTNLENDEHGISNVVYPRTLMNLSGDGSGLIELLTSAPTLEDLDADGLRKLGAGSSNFTNTKNDDHGLTGFRNAKIPTSAVEADPGLVNSTTAASAKEDQDSPLKLVPSTTPVKIDQEGGHSSIELVNLTVKVTESSGLIKATNSTAPSKNKEQEEHGRGEDFNLKAVWSTEEDDTAMTFDEVLAPPWNLSREERITWFMEKIPRIKILHSTEKSMLFDERIKQLFEGQSMNGTSKSCTMRIFMTWIGSVGHFGKRELLSVESVLKAHPNGCVALVSLAMDTKQGRAILEPLLSRGYKVFPVTPDLKQLFNNTPAQGWFEDLKSGKVDPGAIAISQNLANLMRYALLYKYGGIYLDVDMIILKDMSSIRNSLGMQTVDEPTKKWTSLNTAVMIFDKDHPLLLRFIEEFVSHFDGSTWGINGPYLISRVVIEVVNNKHSSNIQLHLLPPMAFYPVHWDHIRRILERPTNAEHVKSAYDQLQKIEAESYAIHLWNKLSRNLKIEQGSIMGRLLASHCIMCEGIYDLR